MEKIKNKYKSKCCGAIVKVHTSPDEIDKVGCTMYHICTKCGEACDVYLKERRTWNINPAEQIIPNKKKQKSTKLTPKELKEIYKNEI